MSGFEIRRPEAPAAERTTPLERISRDRKRDGAREKRRERPREPRDEDGEEKKDGDGPKGRRVDVHA